MSEQPPPIPIFPSQPPPAIAPPPLPTIPMARALSVEEIHGLAERSRPRILSWLGTLSIIIAIAGAAISSAQSMFGLFVWTAAASPRFFSGPGAVGLSSINGMYPNERAAMIQGLSSRGALSPAQSTALDGFLAEEGQKIFDRSVMQITPQTVAASVSRSQRGTHGTSYFLTSGRLDVQDDFVAFYSSSTSMTLNLTGAELNSAIQHIAKMAGTAPTARQQTILRRELSRPEQELSLRGMNGADITQVDQVGNGAIVVHGSGGAVWYLTSDAARVTATSTVSTPPPPRLILSKSAAVLALAESLLSLALCIFLFIVGIMTFRFSRRTRLYYIIYGWAKLALGLLGLWAWTTIALQLAAASEAGQSNNGDYRTFALAWSLGAGLLFLIYPVVVLLAMQSKSVREYHSMMVG
jgi:hypothetical protein